MQFTKQELTALQELINRANISAKEATTVALLQQKIAEKINAEDNKEGKPKKEEK